MTTCRPASSISARRSRSAGPTSKRSGVAATLSTSSTSTARPSSSTTKPQHSRGASRWACSTIRCKRSGAICIAPDDSGGARRPPRVWAGGRAAALLGLDGGALFVVADAAERVLELTHALAHRAPGLGQLLRAQDDEGDDEDDDELREADTRHGASGLSVEGGVDDGSIGAHGATPYHHTVESRLATSSTGSV